MFARGSFGRKVAIHGMLAVGFILLVVFLSQWQLQAIIVMGLLMMWDELSYHGEQRLQGIGKVRSPYILYGMVLCGVIGMSLVLWLPGDYKGMFMTVAIAVVATDAAAELFGRKFGKPGTFFRRYSPNKSLLGAIGGWAIGVLTVLVMIVIWKVSHQAITPIVGYSLLAVPFLATFGDIVASAVKRMRHIDTFGATLGIETGGVLDRLDSWLPSFFVVGMAHVAAVYVG